MYANICFLIAIVCFILDGLGVFPNSRLVAWGSVAFTAGFIAWERIAAEKQKQHDHAVEELIEHRDKPQPQPDPANPASAVYTAKNHV